MGKRKTAALILAISVMSLAIIALVAVMINMNKKDNNDPATNITNAASSNGAQGTPAVKPDDASKNGPGKTDDAAGTGVTETAKNPDEAQNSTSADGSSNASSADPSSPDGSVQPGSSSENNTPEATATPVPPTQAPVESAIKANATVTANQLNVRTGAGTDKAKLKVDGKDFSLTLNNRVEITGVEGDWFHILVDAGGTSYEGYAYGPYITPDAGSGYTAIARPGSTVINITSEKYKDYDNILREWWYTRNTTHTIPGPGYANDISSLFPEYGTYYANTKVSPDDKVMYLTFDAGYENGYTEKILDTLKKHNAKACFFVTTGFVKEAPNIAKRMKEEGHLVGNHTKNHPSLPTRTDEQVMAELTSVEETFKEKTGYTLDPFMRPPQGDFSQRTLKIQQDMGYKTILWSLAIPNDWDTSKQDQVDSFGRFKADHHSGCIALIHSVSKANAEALDKILTFLEDEGYRFGMLTELN